VAKIIIDIGFEEMKIHLKMDCHSCGHVGEDREILQVDIETSEGSRETESK
jgi:hypothetical protein